MREIIAERTQTSKIFDLGNNQRQGQFSVVPIHYLDDNLEWQDCDPTIKDGKLTKAAYYAELIPDKIGYRGKNTEGQEIEIVLEGAGAADKAPTIPEPLFEQNAVIWEDVYKDTDVVLVFTNQEAKFLRVLKTNKAETDYKWGIKQSKKANMPIQFVGWDKDGREADSDIVHEIETDSTLNNKPAKAKVIRDKFQKKVKVLNPTTRKKELSTNIQYPVILDPTINFSPTTMFGYRKNTDFSGTTSLGSTTGIAVGDTVVAGNRILQRIFHTAVGSHTSVNTLGMAPNISGIKQNATINSASIAILDSLIGTFLTTNKVRFAFKNTSNPGLLGVGDIFAPGTASQTINLYPTITTLFDIVGVNSDSSSNFTTATTGTATGVSVTKRTYSVTSLVQSLVSSFDYFANKTMFIMMGTHNTQVVDLDVATASVAPPPDKIAKLRYGGGSSAQPTLIINYTNPVNSFDDAFVSGNTTPCATGGVQRRQDMTFDFSTASPLDTNGMVGDVDATILPPEVFGISASGTNEQGVSFPAHISNITTSVDLGRENINELGRKGPFHRFVTFPVEATCEIEVTSTSGDFISASEGGILTTGGSCSDAGNLQDRTIRIATCDGTRIYLGVKNKLSSVNYSGGDAGGGNVSVSYTFTTFNDFTVMQTGDPNTNYDSSLLATRQTYLRDL